MADDFDDESEATEAPAVAPRGGGPSKGIDVTGLNKGGFFGATAIDPGVLKALPEVDGGVPVKSASGAIGTVPKSELGQALQAGATPVDTDTYHAAKHQAELREKFGGIKGGLAAAGIGAARGLTIGLSDPAAIEAARLMGGDEAAESTREYMEGVKEAHPYASLGGEAAGVLLPSLFTGGAAAGVEGAAEAANAARELSTLGKVGGGLREAIGAMGALPNGIAHLGEATGAGISRLIGSEAESLAGRIIQKGLASAGRGAVEGGLFGVGNEISEDSLGDHELTAEKLLAAAGHGALLGGTFTSALSTAGELSRAVLGRMSPKLRTMAEEQAWKSLSPTKAFSQEAAQRAGGTAAVGRTLLEEGVIPHEEGMAASALSAKDLLPRIQEAKSRIGEELGDVANRYDAHVTFGQLDDAIAKVVKPLEGKAAMEGTLAGVNDLRERLYKAVSADFDSAGAYTKAGGNVEKAHELMRAHPIPIKEFMAQRQALDDLVYGETKSLDPKLRVKFLRQIRGEMAGLEVKAIDEAAEKAGTSGMGEELKALRQKYQHLSIAEKAAERTSDAMVTNRNLSVSDYGTAIAAAASGHVLAAPVAAVAHKLVRTYGNAMAATALTRLSAVGGIERAASAVDREIDRGISGFFAPGERAAPRVRVHTISKEHETPTEAYHARVGAVAAAVARPDFHADTAATAVAPIEAHAPKVSNAFQRTALTATSYLASKIPQGHKDYTSLTPQADKPRVSTTDMARFNRVFDAVHDPSTVLRDMSKGTLTRDQVDAVKAVYPKLYTEMRSKTMDRLSGLKKPLPYQKDVQLRILLDIPGKTLSKPFVQTMQSTFAGKGHNPTQGPGERHTGAPKRMLSHAADSASLEHKD